MNSISERDWKVFTRVYEVALERFCGRVLDEARKIVDDPNKTSHERYLALYKLCDRREKEIAKGFDDYRRSTALLQIAMMYHRGLITEDEFKQFSDDTRNSILALRKIGEG